MLPSIFGMVILAQSQFAGQAKPASANQSANLYKEALEHKGQIKWRPAPPAGILSSVCLILKVCEGSEHTKFVALPCSTECGQPVGRDL